MSDSKIDPELWPAVLQLKSVLGESACFDLNDLPKARDIVAAMADAGKAAAPKRPNIVIETELVHDTNLNIDVEIQTYKRKTSKTEHAAILYIHGGGYVLGGADQAQPKLSGWCEDLGVTIVSVDYRLAPEHPFPAGLYDCFSVLKWLFNNAENLNIDKQRIAIVGESAGGGLAAGLSLYARDHSDFEVAFLCLLYPMIDHTNTESADPAQAAKILWNQVNNKFGWTSYLANQIDESMLPYAVPIMANCLTDLPPTYITVGDQDLFYHESQHFAQRLELAGVDTQLDTYAGGFHGFAEVNPMAAISQRFNQNLFNALRLGLKA